MGSVKLPKVTRIHVIQAVVILIVVLMGWGKRMGSSVMSPLKSTLKHELGIENTQWASLISMVWVFSSVTPFIAGLLVDLMGAPLAGAISILMILLGNGICAMAVGSRRLSIFLAGRSVYSMGGGAVLLVGEVIMLKWFKGRSLPIAFGCASTISGLMSFSGPATVTTVLEKKKSITIPFWISTALSAFGLLVFGFYAFIHYSHYSKDIDNGSDLDIIEDSSRSRKILSDCSLKKECRPRNKAQTEAVSPTLEEGGHFKRMALDKKPTIAESPPDSDDNDSSQTTTNTAAVLDQGTDRSLPIFMRKGWSKCKLVLIGLANLPETYWHILLCISVQGTLFIPLHEIVPEMMETEWGYTKTGASRIFVYLHIVPIVLHVALGVFINRFGHRINIFFIGSVLVFFASIFITFCRTVPILISLIMMNFSGSFVPASIFSLMNLAINNSEIEGAALGLIRSAEFASVTLMEMLDGLLQDADHNRYDTVLIGLVVFASLLLVVALGSVIIDYAYNNGLLNSVDPYTQFEQIAPRQCLITTMRSNKPTICIYEEKNAPLIDSDDKYIFAVQIPYRRYIYIGVIVVLLLTAWSLFIMSLVKM